MRFNDLYQFINPFIEIFINKYFGDKYIFFNNLMQKINTLIEKKYRKDNEKGINICEWTFKIKYYLLILIFILCLLWILYDIFIKSYYMTNAQLGNMIKKQLKLKDIPEFYQIKNIIYFNDNFSTDINFIFFIIIITIILGILYYFYKYLNDNKITDINIYKEFNLFIPVFTSILIFGCIYYIYNFSYMNILSRRVNNLINTIYDNINMQYINNTNICNYLYKKNNLDDYFVYGKCNDIKMLFNQNKLYMYITNIINEIYNIDNNITLEKFKTMKDSKGVFYKHRLSSAFFTFSLIKYYIDNNLINEAKDFFSTYNLTKFKLKPRINPILNLNYDSLLLSSKNLEYSNPNIQRSFNNNKNFYNYVFNDFYNINSTIQNLIVDIYNICKYKMICVYYYYLFVGIIITLIIIYYFIKNYYK